MLYVAVCMVVYILSYIIVCMKRTTIFADEDLMSTLKSIARKEKRSLSATIRKALEEFVARRREKSPLPSFAGTGRSGRNDVAERAEDLLWATRDKENDGA